jgi:hypothetical protein
MNLLIRVLFLTAVGGVYFFAPEILEESQPFLSQFPILGPFLSSSNAELYFRVFLTLLALIWTVALSKTTYMNFVAVVLIIQTIALESYYSQRTYDALPFQKKAQFEFFRILATMCINVLLGIGFFAPKPMTTKHEYYRNRLVQFYKSYNPSKLVEVDAILSRYDKHEEILFTRLKKKYILHDPAVDEDLDSDKSAEVEGDSGEESPDEIPALSPSRTHIQPNEDEEEMKQEGTPPRSANGPQKCYGSQRAVVTSAIEEARAAQEARVEERIRRMATKKAK